MTRLNLRRVFDYNRLMTKPMYVLIVEDLLDLGKELKESIKDLSLDLAISLAPSAEEGILEIGRHNIDLLVTDFRLPGISGLELIRRVRRKNPQARVILTTAVLDAQLEKEAEDLQVSHVLKKPVEIPEFRKAVAATLGYGAETAVEALKPAATPEKKPAVEVKKENEQDQLSRTLFNLHQALKSKCTLWMDTEGEIEKAFGDLPADLPRDVVRKAGKAAALANHDLSALLLAPQRTGLHYQPGIKSDLFAACTDVGMIVAIFAPGLTPETAGEKIQQLLSGVPEVRRLAQMDLGEKVINGSEKNAAAAPQAGDEELEKLLGASGQVNPSAADDFWEGAGTASKADLGNPNLLTYEQAQKMGLKVKK